MNAECLTGGVWNITRGKLADHVIAKGRDPTGFERWTWMQFQGLGGVHLKVHTAHRPVENTQDAGSMCNQHLAYYHKHGLLNSDPRQTFLLDLVASLKADVDAGDNIPLGMDAMSSDSSPVRTALEAAGLVDLICRDIWVDLWQWQRQGILETPKH